MPDLDHLPHAPAGAASGPFRATYRRLRSPSRLRSTADYLGFAVLAFVAMVASRPGVVTDDTKTYLYLDPGRYVRQAVSLWDPNVALGTVTHENIGYLLPMGPFYWVLAELHVPLWVAQRLWMGSLLFAAGAGALYLCRTINLSGPGRYLTALAFMFTPYVLQYAGRISVILMPWAGLPWMVAFVILALRRGGWKYPALFALVVALVSGINASSVLYVGIAPALWLPYSVLVARDTTWRKAWGVAWKVGLLSALVSLWWAIGLQVEAAYGINVLKYTETVPTTSSTSLASEVIRGLGYWYFYGSDRVGAWTQSSVSYSQNGWLVGLSFAVPALSFLAAAFVKWRYRAYFVLVVVVGMVLSVGAYPYTHPSGIGSILKAIMVDTTAGLAMRSTDRATPLVILALAIFLGAGVTALVRRVHRTGLIIGAFGAVAVLGASAPLWTGAIIANGFTQPATPPASVEQAAKALNATHPGTRVYALPGNNFAAYRWGDTIDTVYPALLTRPFVTHEQQIMGSLPTADLLSALDSPLQDGTEDWAALAPVASLMSAGDVLVQYDQQYERYDTPNPLKLASDLTTTPPGLSDPTPYGTPVPNVSTIASLDEQALALPANQTPTPPLVSYTVKDPRPVVRADSLAQPLIVDGDASGIVNAASAGLLAGNPTILYAGTLDTDKKLERSVLKKPADLVVTDTNRKQGYRWNSLNENTGYTETASQGPDTSDPTDAPIDLFPGAPVDAQTTTVFNGLASVTASSYGSSITYLPEVRPAAAIDDNTQTSWLDDSFAAPDGQWWQVALLHPLSAGSVTLVQPQTGDPDRWITKVTLTFDGHSPVTVDLGASSHMATGQKISFPTRTFTTLRVTIDRFAASNAQALTGFGSSVGLAEVEIPGMPPADETVSMPQDLLRAAGSSSLGDRLTLVMTRLRSNGAPPRSDIETTLQRAFWLPTARTFSLSGEARISPLVPDDEIDRLVGRPGADHTGIVAYSEGRLPGDLKAGAIATVDDNSSTIWEPGFGASHQTGQWLEYDLPKPITFDHLDLQIVADGEHSVPTSITVTAGGGSAHVTLPPIADSRVAGSVVDVPVSFSPLTGQNIRITVDTVDIQNTVNYDSDQSLAMPIGIAEVGIPGLQAAPVPTDIPSGCLSDLLTVDGAPISVSISGTSAAALDSDPLNVTLCGPDANGLTLGPGSHTLRSTNPLLFVNGVQVGFDLDQLVLDSAPGGGAEPEPPASIAASGDQDQVTSPTTAATAAAPVVHLDSQTATAMRLTVTGVPAGSGASPFELVLGQSFNAGWTATVDAGSSGSTGSAAASGSTGSTAASGGTGNTARTLGAPVLIDGFANGWEVDPATLGAALHDGTFTVTLVWTPQRRVDIALIISILAILACLLMAFLPRRWRRLPRRLRLPRWLRLPRRPRWLPRSGAWGLVRWPSWARQQAPPADTITAEVSNLGDQAARVDRPATDRPAEVDGPPELAVPFRYEGARSTVWASLVIGVITGLVAGAISLPITGAAVGVATVLALLVPRTRMLLGLVAAALIIVTGTYVTVLHNNVQAFATGPWPTQFPLASSLAWAGVVFLGADATVEAVGRWRAARRSAPSDAVEPPPS